MVLMYDNRHQKFPSKLHTLWLGPFKVTEVFSNGSLQLEDMQKNKMEVRVNGSRVKKYHLESDIGLDTISKGGSSEEGFSGE